MSQQELPRKVRRAALRFVNYQLRWFADRSPMKLAVKARRVGGSTMLAYDAACKGVGYDYFAGRIDAERGGNVNIISASKKQAQDILRAATDHVRSMDALPPEHLLNLVDKPMRELEERKQLIRQTVDELKTLKASTTYPVPKIRFIEQQGLEDFLYSNIATWQESVKKTDHTWWGIQDYTFLKHFGKFNDWYWSQPISEGVRMCQIGNESEEERRLLRRIKKQTRDVRFSSDMLFTSSVWVGGEYLIMIFTRQQPFYLVEIHDAMLASNMREVFKKLWQGYQTNR
jgi:hypothetical protein